MQILQQAIESEDLRNLYFDISWDEVAKYVVSSEEALQATAKLLNAHPNRFLFGTDVVAPTSQEGYLAVYEMYEPLWKLLTPEAKQKVTKGNFERLFDAAAQKVRAWEAANK
jgi:predicted TIM-barrel fold metal-dependent hydrolase